MLLSIEEHAKAENEFQMLKYFQQDSCAGCTSSRGACPGTPIFPLKPAFHYDKWAGQDLEILS